MLYGASIYGWANDLASRVRIARDQRLNTIRITDWLDGAHTWDDPHAWSNLDSAIAAVTGYGFNVVLDCATYRNLLARTRVNPYTADWTPFVTFLANRYGHIADIAVISIAGEAWPAAGNVENGNADAFTRLSLTAFYVRTAALFRKAFPNVPISSGGLLHYAADNSGDIDWQGIGLAVDILGLHVYSGAHFPGAQNRATGKGDEGALMMIAQWCKAAGRAWMIEEFGVDQVAGDAARAATFNFIYGAAVSLGAMGVLHWNCGPELVGVAGKANTYDVNESTPLTHKAVILNGPTYRPES